MDAVREPVSGRVDRVDQRRQLVASPAHDVQHRAEHFARQHRDAADAAEIDRCVGATNVPRAHSSAAAAGTRAAPRACIAAMCACERVARVGVDHRADIGGEPARIARHRARAARLRACEHDVGDVVLQAQDAQRRAALARAVERRASASATTCSGSAELSTIIAFWPPVSAISTGSSSRFGELADG